MYLQPFSSIVDSMSDLLLLYNIRADSCVWQAVLRIWSKEFELFSKKIIGVNSKRCSIKDAFPQLPGIIVLNKNYRQAMPDRELVLGGLNIQVLIQLAGPPLKERELPIWPLF